MTPDSSPGTAAGRALVVLGCPEVPVQQALALYLLYQLREEGYAVHATGNPTVLNLLKVSDPEKRYLPDLSVLETCIGELAEKRRDAGLCIVFAHSDAGISYAATLRHLLPEARLVLIIFGKEPEALAALANFPCEKVVEKAVHNPMQIRKKINGVFGWAV